MTNYKLTVIIEREGRRYVSYCPELQVATQGKTVSEALKNLREAVELYLEEADPSELTLPTEPPMLTTLEVAVK